MDRKCPNCKSFNVRRSSTQEFGVSREPLIKSPYRCRDCGEMFWVIARKTYTQVGIVVGINLVFLVVIYWFITMANNYG